MPEMRRRGAAVLCASIIIIVSLLAGCAGGGIYANYSAIEDLQLVKTLAVDRAGVEGTALTVSTGSGGAGETPLVLRGEGGGLSEAIDALRDRTPRGDLFFDHTRFIVLGEDYAAAGIRALLDFTERDVQLRLGTELFVLRGADAGSLVSAAAETEFDVGEALDSVKRVVSDRADSSVDDLRRTAVALSEYGAALVCAIAPAETEGHIFPAEEGETPVPAGYAVLHGGALAGYLEGAEAEAASLLTGRAARFLRTAPLPDGGGATLLCEPEGVELSVQWRGDGTPELAVDVRLAAVVTEIEGDAQSVTDPAALAALGAAAEAQVRRDIEAVLARSRELDADFLALGGVLRRSGAARFAALGAGWLRELDCTVTVRCAVAHSYDLNDPVGTEGGE